MTKKCNFSCKKLFLYLIIFSLALQSMFSKENETWTVAAEKFTFSKGQIENNVTAGIAETLPKSILENLNQVLERNINIDEKLERTAYDLRTKRQSLYLQLSNEYKKRDVLFLTYTDNKLKKELLNSEKEINKIKKQIDDNLSQFKKAESEMRKKAQDEQGSASSFFKSIITNEESVFSTEQIKLYNNDPENLVDVSIKARKMGYESSLFEKEIYGKGINGLITGNITGYGDYISVAVDLYLYPGAIKIGSVMEVGSLNDLELISSSIVSQLIPIMTNSMPVSLIFQIEPKEVINSIEIYVDDILQKNHRNGLTINGGVHSFKIAAKGYKSLSTNYYFEGNKKYNIEIKMEPKNEGSLMIHLKNPLEGKLYVNGVLGDNIDESNSKITINGTHVLGQFISEDGKTSFFYVPESLYYDGNAVTINPKPIDRGEKIDKRRRWMYGAYSGFMLSLIPTFITKGQFINVANQYSEGLGDFKTAQNWQVASNVCLGLSIGAGIFWGVELVRYLIAANSVLPEKAKEVHLMDLENTKENKKDHASDNETNNEKNQLAGNGDKK